MRWPPGTKHEPTRRRVPIARYAPCRGRDPARACRRSPRSWHRRTASARSLASRTSTRRFGAPPGSRDRRGASRASSGGGRGRRVRTLGRATSREKDPEDPAQVRSCTLRASLRGRQVRDEKRALQVDRVFWSQPGREVRESFSMVDTGSGFDDWATVNRDSTVYFAQALKNVVRATRTLQSENR